MKNNPNTSVDPHHIIKIFEEFFFFWQFWSDYLGHDFTLSYFFYRVKYFDTIFLAFRSSKPRYDHTVQHRFLQISLDTYFHDDGCWWWVDRGLPWCLSVQERGFLLPRKRDITHHHIFVLACCHSVCEWFLQLHRAREHISGLSNWVCLMVWVHPFIAVFFSDYVLR